LNNVIFVQFVNNNFNVFDFIIQKHLHQNSIISIFAFPQIYAPLENEISGSLTIGEFEYIFLKSNHEFLLFTKNSKEMVILNLHKVITDIYRTPNTPYEFYCKLENGEIYLLEPY